MLGYSLALHAYVVLTITYMVEWRTVNALSLVLVMYNRPVVDYGGLASTRHFQVRLRVSIRHS